MSKKPLGYLGGDIMSFGSNLAREYEYNKFIEKAKAKHGDKYDYSNVEKDNYRNGYSKKTVHSTNGDIELNIPRDRNGDFEPTIVKKDQKIYLI